jgi:WD40 repeat protein
MPKMAPRNCESALRQLSPRRHPADHRRLFMHGGHTNRVSEFAWNVNDPWVMVSAAEDNLIQCWKVSTTIVGKDTMDPAADELE